LRWDVAAGKESEAGFRPLLARVLLPVMLMSPAPARPIATLRFAWLALLPGLAIAQQGAAVSTELPAPAAAQLARSLAASSTHAAHVWRDTPPLNADGTVNGYIEIARGDRRKWEFSMAANVRAIDRIMPDEVGGYPVNYGFVPQTVSYDGDPFDILVLGPPIEGGRVVRGAIAGLMLMDDEKGPDAKVVVSTLDAGGRPRHALTDADRQKIAGYFRRYKRHEAGKFSRVPGWGSIADGLAWVQTTHRFFNECRGVSGGPCSLAPR
jgi:inorganic pyrophosphatase